MPRPSSALKLVLAVTGLFALTPVVAGCDSPRAPVTACPVTATARWDDHSENLADCAARFGIAVPAATLHTSQRLVIVKHTTNANLPRVETSDPAVLTRVDIGPAATSSDGEVIAAFQAAQIGTAYLYLPAGRVAAVPCATPTPRASAEAQCPPSDQVLLIRAVVAP